MANENTILLHTTYSEPEAQWLARKFGGAIHSRYPDLAKVWIETEDEPPRGMRKPRNFVRVSVPHYANAENAVINSFVDWVLKNRWDENE